MLVLKSHKNTVNCKFASKIKNKNQMNYCQLELLCFIGFNYDLFKIKNLPHAKLRINEIKKNKRNRLNMRQLNKI